MTFDLIIKNYFSKRKRMREKRPSKQKIYLDHEIIKRLLRENKKFPLSLNRI